MRWELEPNAFLARLSLVSGKTSSPRTWRSYGYQLADWLSFCERAKLDWKRATELNIATYRNILAAESSPHTGRLLKRSTINHKLTVICQFYRFAQKKGWIDALPFELETARLSHRSQVNLAPCAKTNHGSRGRIALKLSEGSEELEIPPRREVRRFVRSFRTWRDQLIAQVMWLTGMRCAEVCTLPLDSLPDNPDSVPRETVPIKITGKGQKRRAVLFPLRLLRSIDRYIRMERRSLVKSGAADPGTVFVGRAGRLLQTVGHPGRIFDQPQTDSPEDYPAPFEALLCRRTAGLSPGHWCTRSPENGPDGTRACSHGNDRTISSCNRADEGRCDRHAQQFCGSAVREVTRAQRRYGTALGTNRRRDPSKAQP